MARTKPQSRKPEPPPVDPLAAVAPLVAWWVQAHATIRQLESQASAVREELSNPACPWLPYVDAEAMGAFCWSIIGLVDNYLTPPFRAACPAANPLAGLAEKPA